jgi:hypothetical protein
MSEAWGISVQWGFKKEWTTFSDDRFACKEDADLMIANIRKLANRPDCHPAHIAYRNLPMQAAKLGT